jgi:hypothetical protein
VAASLQRNSGKRKTPGEPGACLISSDGASGGANDDASDDGANARWRQSEQQLTAPRPLLERKLTSSF